MKITTQNYEEHALDYIEGALSAEGREAFERFLTDNPTEAARVRPLLGGLPVLTPDASVRFEDKASLKRRAPVRRLYVRMASAAAVLLAGGVLIFNAVRTDETPVPVLADSTPVPVPASVGLRAESLDKPIEESPAGARKLTVPEPSIPAPAAAPARQIVWPAVEPVELTPTDAAAEPEPVVPLSAGVSLIPTTSVARVVSVTREYVIEQTGEPVLLADGEPATDDAPAADEPIGNSTGFLNLLSRRGLRGFASRVIAPLSEISPIEVHENNAGRVVEFASIPVSRRVKPANENQ